MTKKWAPINAPGVGASAPSADGDEIDAPDAAPDTAAGPAAPTGKPSVTTARAMTVRMDPGEADDVDRFVLDLRDESGQRLDKADVVRELIRLARFDPAVRRKLIRRLR